MRTLRSFVIQKGKTKIVQTNTKNITRIEPLELKKTLLR